MTEKETKEENRFTTRTRLWLMGQDVFHHPLREAAERAKKHLDTERDREGYLAELVGTMLEELREHTRVPAGPYLGPAGLGLMTELLTLACEQVDCEEIARDLLKEAE